MSPYKIIIEKKACFYICLEKKSETVDLYPTILAQKIMRDK